MPDKKLDSKRTVRTTLNKKFGVSENIHERKYNRNERSEFSASKSQGSFEGKKSFSRNSDRKPFGERRSFSRDSERKPFGERRSFSRDGEYRERKSFGGDKRRSVGRRVWKEDEQTPIYRQRPEAKPKQDFETQKEESLLEASVLEATSAPDDVIPPWFKKVLALTTEKGREREGNFIGEGIHVVQELVTHHADQVIGVYYAESFQNAELLDLVEMEVRELLSEYGFPGDDTPIIRGSALKALEGDPHFVAQVELLMATADEYIPDPVRETDKPFLMPVEDVFSITGRGTVATGRVERGTIKVGEEVELVGLGETKKTTVTGVEMFRKQLDQGQAGDNVGLLLRGVDKTEIQRGQVLCKPGSIKPHTKFTANVYVLTKDEGGRHTPFFPGYRPQFYIRTTDVTGSIRFGGEMVMPGDNVVMEVELINPVAIEEGMRFAIREGGRTVGAGVVDKIME